MCEENEKRIIDEIMVVLLASLSNKEKKKFIKSEIEYFKECKKRNILTDEEYLEEVERFNSIILRSEREKNV